MGKSNEQKQNEQQRRTLIEQTNRRSQSAFEPSPLENEMASWNQGQQANATRANQMAFQDYGNLMGSYRGMFDEISGRSPTTFSWDNVDRPEQLDEAYGYLREAMPGYRDFANTGGYSDQDIQELRARGINPIRSAYSGAIRDIDRSRNLSGGGANYIAARSRAQRELPQQVADATTNVNAGLADAIRQGKLAGLAGISGIGSTMGGLSAQDMQRMLANSQGNLQASGMTENAYQNWIGNRMGALNSQAGLYGTTPGMASMFGNQALQGMGQRGQMESSRNNFGLGLIDINSRLLDQQQNNQGRPWWQTALGIAGTAAPYLSMLSDKNAKKDISRPLSSGSIVKGIKKLNLHKWKYKGDNTTHMGPMAQDFKKHLGVGDGKTIHLADVAGVMLATAKEMAS